MKVYVVRHGIAVPHGAPGVLDDRSRELTPDGAKKVRRHAAALARLGVVVDEVWTSSLSRARQTADILADGLEVAARPRVVKALEPGGDIRSLTHQLSQRADRKGIMLVGHEPDLGRLATHLITGLTRTAIEFKKGAVACIAIDDFKAPLRGRLRWLLTPRQMRLMA